MRYSLTFLLLFSCTLFFGQVLDQKSRAKVKDELFGIRLNTVLPELMDQAGIDMWILISREYNEDPVLKTMLPSTWLNARRRTMIVFYRNRVTDTLEKLAVARYDIGKHITSSWNKEVEPDQWGALNRIIEDRNPTTIGINISDHFGIADGLVQTDYNALNNAVSETTRAKFVSAEKLCIGWIETRTSEEMEYFEELVQITHDIIDEAFSNKVIHPGVTTMDDVVWWMRDKVTQMGLNTWFHPTVDIQRSGEALKSQLESFSKKGNSKIIQKGDLLHCDFGISYLGLNTDCQQMAYVLRDGETEAPVFLKNAFAQGNLIQDILTSNIQEGLTGNEILLKSLGEGAEKGLRPAIYSHPLGTYGHSSGTTIGMWDSQGGVPVKGDYPIHVNTAYAIELNTTVAIPEWGKDIRIMLEEAGFYGNQGFRYVNGRQEELKIIDARADR
jgi:Xaa-Pro aminopeptidase